MKWNDEREELLKKLWTDGLSASQIACELGCFGHCTDKGRNAVIGKVHRLGLSGRMKPPSQKKRKPRAPSHMLEVKSTKKGRLPKEVVDLDGTCSTDQETVHERRTFPLGKPLFLSAREKRLMGIDDSDCHSHMPPPSDELPAEVIQFIEREFYR